MGGSAIAGARALGSRCPGTRCGPVLTDEAKCCDSLLVMLSPKHRQQGAAIGLRSVRTSRWKTKAKQKISHLLKFLQDVLW